MPSDIFILRATQESASDDEPAIEAIDKIGTLGPLKLNKKGAVECQVRQGWFGVANLACVAHPQVRMKPSISRSAQPSVCAIDSPPACRRIIFGMIAWL